MKVDFNIKSVVSLIDSFSNYVKKCWTWIITCSHLSGVVPLCFREKGSGVCIVKDDVAAIKSSTKSSSSSETWVIEVLFGSFVFKSSLTKAMFSSAITSIRLGISFSFQFLPSFHWCLKSDSSALTLMSNWI